MLQPRVPRSLLNTERTEHDDLALDVVEGALPSDLTGHLFVVAPAGTVGSAPGQRDTTLMVGDGMVQRFDLSGAGVKLTTRIPRTADLLADEITHDRHDLAPFRFTDAGLVRIGLLGSRDFANTAFVPMTKPGEATRLVLTYDAGRPIEIDPSTLEVATAIGHRDEWRAEALPNTLFPTVLSPAHPMWDPHTEELFTINYGRGVVNILETVPVVAALAALPHSVVEALDKLATVIGFDGVYRKLEKLIAKATTALDRAAEDFLDTHLPRFIPDTFTDLVRWDGEGAFERWRLVLPNGREVAIQQSIHQIAVTREHVLVLETGFKIGLQSGFSDTPPPDLVDRALRAILTRPQLPTTTLYVVPRASLNSSAPTGDDGVRRVECRAVSFPLESDHFVADYDDAGGRVTVHLAHSPATDLSEWVRPYDVSAYDGRGLDPALNGMLAVGAMDVGRFGRYVIDAHRGTVVDTQVIADERTSWALALYAGAGLNTDAAPPEKIESIYWCAEGCFPELLTEFVFDLYEDYPHRLVPSSEIRAMGEVGRPSAVHRLDTAGLRLADRYVLPDGVMAGSLQYVPRGPGPTEGYLVGTMYTPARTELWVLDAADLAAGPVCKLASGDWRIGFSLHTAWLPSIAPRTSSYRILQRDELSGAVSQLPGSDRLAQAFEDDLYPILDP